MNTPSNPYATNAPNANGKLYYDASGSGIHANGTPRDPWNEMIQVALDLDGDGKANVNGTLVNASVVVWSKGANKKNEFGGGDDVKGWCIFKAQRERAIAWNIRGRRPGRAGWLHPAKDGRSCDGFICTWPA